MPANTLNRTFPVTGVILAGGKNIRMGVNKAFITVDGQRIVDRTAALFNALFRQVILVTNSPLAYASMDIEIAFDLIPHTGPLAGIYTGLRYASSPYSFVAGCDMPLISRPVLEYMIALCPGHDLIIPRLEDGYHPLHAIYSSRCMQPVETLIQAGQFKITGLFPRVRVREVTARELRPLDRELRSFVNLNTPEDLSRLAGK